MIIHGDSLQELAKIDTESVDLLCTDPPYGYSFMGKSWDKTLPDLGIFKECHRVLKAGAFAFVMSAPRSDVCARMMLMLEDAGFNIGFTPIYWTYASGFPKAMNIGKMVDKRMGTPRPRIAGGAGTKGNTFPLKPEAQSPEAQSPEAQSLEGSYGGFQPKPAVEVVIVAMKPLSEKTFVDQALKNGKGITWLDDCRVPTAEKLATGFYSGEDAMGNAKGNAVQGERQSVENTQGRFPANLLVSDDVLNDGRITKSNAGVKNLPTSNIYGGNSLLKSKTLGTGEVTGISDSGSYSRYFSLDAWAKTLPFLIVPKASRREKNEGLGEFPVRVKQSMGSYGDQSQVEQADGAHRIGNKGESIAQNHHPTVKPLTLMFYLITLGSRPGDVVLDPFLGSGTTALAAKQLGRKYIGIEREGEYVEIAEARLKAVQDALL